MRVGEQDKVKISRNEKEGSSQYWPLSCCVWHGGGGLKGKMYAPANFLVCCASIQYFLPN